MDDEKIKKIVYSVYLALGSIALFLSLNHLAITLYDLAGELFFHGIHYPNEYYFKWFVLVFLAGISGVLLTITYYGFLHSKRYTRTVGLVGCIILLTFTSYCLFEGNFDFWYILINLAYISLLIITLLLLIFTLVFWKKLA